MKKRDLHLRNFFRLALILFLACSAPAVLAQNLKPASLDACVRINNDAQRLACYDRLAGRKDARASESDQQRRTVVGPEKQHEAQSSGGLVAAPRDHLHQNQSPDYQSLLDSRWELDQSSKLGTFNIRAYKPVYVEPFFITSDVNQTPVSPNPDNVVHQGLGLQRVEAKFQISFKTKLVEGLFFGYGDIWAAYTQSSRWQVYNSDLSRPFRETNYQPEVMAIFGTDVPVFGWHLRLLGIGVSHQSNGRAEPLSRSWNRVIGRIGLERPGWTIMLRPWVRLPEDPDKNDNPNIIDYFGHGDLRIVHVWGGQEFALMLRHNFSTGHGATRFTWSFPIGNGLHGYLELFNGYGESLIDYNHHATYLGLGISLIGWY